MAGIARFVMVMFVGTVLFGCKREAPQTVATSPDTPVTAPDTSVTVPATKPVEQAGTSAEAMTAIRKEIEAAGHGNANGRRDIVAAGFDYLAEHADDEAVRMFDPAKGFTHYTVSDKDGAKMLLVERATPNGSGLNIHFDKSGKVDDVKYWGPKAEKP